MTHRRIAWFVLPLVAAVVVLPLVQHGCSCGHDFDFHLLNWLEAAQQFRHGNLHPQWATTPAWNAGEPRFVFYPPLSWYLGALLTLAAAGLASLLHLAPATAFAATPIAYSFLVLLAGGAALFRVARPLAGISAGLVAATVYMANPYALFTAYERTAYAELLAMALFPLLFAVMLPGPSLQPADAGEALTATPRQPRIASLAIIVALLWLSNTPAAIMGCYTLALLAALRVAILLRHRRSPRPALTFAARTTAATALGFALAAFYLVPAIAERRWVQLSMAILPGMRPEDNTLFHRTGDAAHDAVLHTASLIAVLLTTAGMVAAIAMAVRRRDHRRPAGPEPRTPSHPLPVPLRFAVAREDLSAALLVAIAALIALLLTPVAAALWRHGPELAFLQFPWRLLAEQACLVALLIALALRGRRLRTVSLAALCIAVSVSLTLPAYHAFRQSCDADDTPKARFAAYTSADPQRRGAEPTDEYTPAAADNDALAETNPPYRLVSPSESADAPPPPGSANGPAPRSLDLHLRSPMLLILNLRDLPAWWVTRNGTPLPDHVARGDGLLAVALPAGDSHLTVVFRLTRAEKLGDLTSVLALGTLIVLWRRREPNAAGGS